MALKKSEIFDILHAYFVVGISINSIASSLGYSQPTASKYIKMATSLELIQFECSIKELEDTSALFARDNTYEPYINDRCYDDNKTGMDMKDVVN